MNEKFSLDSKDRRILYELDKNSRIPISSLGKKARISREVADYRVRNLLKRGVIRKFLAIIDLSTLGYTHYKICIQLRGMSEKKEKEFVQSLVGNPFVSWVASCDGPYSMAFAIRAKDMFQLSRQLQSAIGEYGDYFIEKDIAPIVEAQHFNRDYLVGKSGSERQVTWGGPLRRVELDETYFEILDVLAKNSRATSTEIAGMLGMSPDGVIGRIKKLEAAGTLKGYMVFLNNALAGQLYYKVLVSFKEMTPDEEKSVSSFCRDHPNIVYTVKTFGKWDFEMDIEVKNTVEFRRVMRDFVNRFSGLIKRYYPLNIYEEYKFDFFDKRILTGGGKG